METSPAVPRRLPAILSGVVAALAAIGSGHLAAGLIQPSASPALVVASALVDLAPTPVKEFVVRTLGTYDKPVLIGLVTLVVLLLGGALGLLARSRPRPAMAGIVLLGVVPGALALIRAQPLVALLPSLVAVLVGLGAFILLRRLIQPAEPESPLQAGERRRRRQVLLGLAGGGVLAAAAAGGGQVIADRRPGGASAAGRALPAPMSPAPALPDGVQAPDATPFQTSIEDFYRVDISLTTPRIEVEGWSLTIDGMVEQPITLSYDDLLAMPMIERDITFTCVSNEVGGPYVSTGRWLGVPFSEILDRVRLQPGVEQAFSYSLDSGYTCSTPIGPLTDGRDAMIAVGMNGEVLPDKNGFPARMLVPGLFGFVSGTKWLRRIEFTTYAERTAYWTERDWATDAPILTQSRIDHPKALSTSPGDDLVLSGIAWAQHRGIERVEVRIDDGEWRRAELATDGGLDLWRQWTLPFKGDPGRHTAEVRATDATGETQTDKRTKVFPDGARGWHQIVFNTE